MTTIIATKTKILSDGKTTVGNRVDDYDFKKVRKIGDYLVGGAGRLTSILTFFAWFEQNLQCQAAQESIPGLMIQSDPDKDDEDFIALVVHPDGKIFIHEGADPRRAFPIEREYYAVGSGADFALAALDAGATPEQAMEVAKLRDAFSGGETFVEEREEIVDITDEDLRNFSREQLLNLLLTGSPEGDAAQQLLAAPEEEHPKGDTGELGVSGCGTDYTLQVGLSA
jgi:ATP-dependent protease HslVU (ClpYQ) peptidase subunit